MGISRAEERRQLKKMKKKVKDLTIEEFKALIDESAGDALDRGFNAGFDIGIRAVISALKRVFGFGDKRIDRLMKCVDKDMEVTNGIKDTDGNNDSDCSDNRLAN